MAMTLTERPSTQVRAAPGGESSVAGILGGDDSANEHVGTTTSNKFASGANPNSGNVLTERSSTRVHAAPGGESSLILGGSSPADVNVSDSRTTSNTFACGANPNAGNVLTDRPSTQVRAAPGGESSLGSILGGDNSANERVGTTTSNKFASGANPNSGNVLTERSSTRVHAAPGGESSLGSILGDISNSLVGDASREQRKPKKTSTSNTGRRMVNDENINTMSLSQVDASQGKKMQGARHPSASSIMLG